MRPLIVERESQEYPGRKVMVWPSWAWLFGNEEDSIDGSANGFWPKQIVGSWAWYWQIIRWSAWRNSVGNARWTRLFGVTVDPDDIVLVSWPAEKIDSDALKEGPYVVRQGWRYEVKRCWNPKQPDWHERRYLWIGWRLAQQTKITPGVGLAFQLRAAL